MPIAFEDKPRLIRKEKNLPLITCAVVMLTSPLQTFSSMAWHEWNANGGREAFDAQLTLIPSFRSLQQGRI
ncbi:hypothetical protein TNCV_4300771 [Trichonephila clavipes]|nr:hypothetical protein TNCV_4300771 [Trichonephila clavipes]